MIETAAADQKITAWHCDQPRQSAHFRLVFLPGFNLPKIDMTAVV